MRMYNSMGSKAAPEEYSEKWKRKKDKLFFHNSCHLHVHVYNLIGKRCKRKLIANNLYLILTYHLHWHGHQTSLRTVTLLDHHGSRACWFLLRLSSIFITSSQQGKFRTNTSRHGNQFKGIFNGVIHLYSYLLSPVLDLISFSSYHRTRGAAKSSRPVDHKQHLWGPST